MAWSYNPKDAASAWDAGDYEASIVKVDEGTSGSSGAPMLTVTFKVYNGDKERTLKDYIVNPSTLFKLKKLAVALGEGVAFGLGKFDPGDHINANLMLTLAVEESDEYGDQNKIKGYKPLSRQPAARPAPRVPATLPASAPGAFDIADKDIPF